MPDGGPSWVMATVASGTGATGKVVVMVVMAAAALKLAETYGSLA
jgi:hypothetical protein